MNVFLAGIMQGSMIEADIQSQDWREPIKRTLATHIPKADVYCHYSEHPNSIAYELPEIQATLADGMQRASQCDLLIAYVPSASMGTAIEMYEAYRAGAKIVTITPLTANWVIRSYSDAILPNLEAFDDYVACGNLTRLIDDNNNNTSTK